MSRYFRIKSARKRYRSIPVRVLAYMAWRNIVTKKLRSGLTILGIVIGIGAIYFLLSFGIGLRNIVTQEVLGSQSVRSIDISTPNSKILKLDSDNAHKIQNLPHVKELSTSFAFPGSVRYNGSEVEGIVYGIDPAYQDMTTLNLIHGRLQTRDDVRTAILNRSALKAMGVSNPSAVIGKNITVIIPLTTVKANVSQVTVDLKIIGVIDSGAGTEMFIPKFNFEAAGLTTYSDIRLLSDDTKHVAGLRGQIESLGYQTASPQDTINQIDQIFKFFNVALFGFGMIGMVVAVLGMFNTLTISLLERTKEIGLMIALGGRPRDMRRLFILEASMLSFIGALSGILLATVGGGIINLIMNHFARSRGVTQHFNLFASPPWLVLGTLLFMVGVGLLVVYFPARRAQRINPIDALRRE